MRAQLFKDRQNLGPMNNYVLLEPRSMYLDGEELNYNTEGEPSELPPLIENLRLDKDAKVVSQEVYFYLKQLYGVQDVLDGGSSLQDVYRLRN